MQWFMYSRKHCCRQCSSHILLPFFVVLFCAFNVSNCHKIVSQPCTDMHPLKWVRHPQWCDTYYICHYGQPLNMPPCPKGQVWGLTARNCVPESSRWNDCSSAPTITRRYHRKTLPTSKPKLLRGSRRYQRYKGRIVTSRHNPLSAKRNGEVKQPEKVSKVYTTKSWNTGPLSTSTPPAWGHPDGPSDQNVVVEWYETPRPTTNTPVSRNRYGGTKTPTRWGKPVDVRRKKPRLQKTSEQQRLLNKAQQTVDRDHVCLQQPGALLPHPEMCHWYYNCSLTNLDDTSEVEESDYDDGKVLNDNREGFIRLEPYRVRKAGVFVWECRYPQLFDDTTNRCREFLNVKCGTRYEAVDQCEYSSRECHKNQCTPCDQRFGRCRGQENGIYPLPRTRWSSVFVTCYLQRNIAQDECQPPTPIFSPEKLDCVSLYEVPKRNGGLLPDCSTRPDGYYPDEQGRCAIFFRCSIGQFRGYDECPPGSVFDPAIPACQPFLLASKPCGEGQAPLCGGKLDGHYADPYGRCTHFFQCKRGLFQRYYSCDSGIFDPQRQQCITDTELVMRPCGLKPNPCETLPTGVYPDQVTGCKHFIECHHGIMVTNGTCDRGRVFSAITGRCDLPENTPAPCGFAATCSDRPDGRYPALNRGCSFFYECFQGQFISLRRCTAADGGFFFNPGTGKCDYPQSICPPCGYKWWGCTNRDMIV